MGEVALGFLSLVIARLGKRAADDIADGMYDFAKKRIVDAYKQLRKAIDDKDTSTIQTAKAEFEDALAEDPDAAEVVRRTFSEIQRVDPFAVICAVVDEMLDILTSNDLTPMRERPPGCGVFTGSFSNPVFLTAVDFRRNDGTMKPPESNEDELTFAGSLGAGYNAEMWILQAKEGVRPVELADSLNQRMWSTRDPVIPHGLVSGELRKDAQRVWIVEKVKFDRIEVFYPDPELRAAEKAAGDDIRARIDTYSLDTPARRRAAEEKPLFYIDDSSGVRALIESTFRLRELRRNAVTGGEDEWRQALRMLFPES